jgi:hypothetical protein
MHRRGYKVKPLSIRSIRQTANGVRKLLQIEDVYVDIARLCEHTLTEMGLVVEWCAANELWDREADVRTDIGLMRIREDVYLRALDAGEVDVFAGDGGQVRPRRAPDQRREHKEIDQMFHNSPVYFYWRYIFTRTLL